MQHIRENVKLNCSSEVARRFVSMAYADTAASYFDILRLVKEECDEKAHSYLTKLDPERFARFAVPVARYGHESSNTVESMNGQLCEQREKPILKLLEGIWDRQMQQKSRHSETALQLAATSAFPFTPRAITFLTQEQEKSRTLRVSFEFKTADHIVAKVVSSVSLDVRQRVVDLRPQQSSGTCSCLLFQDMGMPCCHAQKVCEVSKLDFIR